MFIFLQSSSFVAFNCLLNLSFTLVEHVSRIVAPFTHCVFYSPDIVVSQSLGTWVRVVLRSIFMSQTLILSAFGILD